MIRYLIHRPIAVTMILIAVVVVGIVGIRNIPVSLMPDIDIPQISVQANVPGYSVQEMESKVIAPLRGQLARVPGVKSVSSDARMDVGSILLKFEAGANIGQMFIEVNEKVDMAMGGMPKEVARPKVIKASATDIPAFYLDISFKDEKTGEPASARFAQLSDFAKNVVSRRLEQLPAAAMVDVSGIASSEILCVPDDDKLRASGITMEELQNAMRNNDIQLSALTVQDGIYRYNVHFDSQVLTVDDVRNIYINHQGRLFQLKDLCDIKELSSYRRNINRHDGRNCVTLAVVKQNDAQMADLQKAVDEVLDDMRKNYPTMQFDVTRDQTELLAYSIHNLEWNLLAAAFFTLLVLLFFMRKWRLALLVVLSIPISLIITLLCFNLIGISLNIISLSGLILGVGMIVDNSIIVIDNILQKLSKGKGMVDAVCQGTAEVFTPMLSSVLTTCSVFLPLIFIGGMAGALFFDQSMGIAIALFSSLLVAMVVLPVYFHQLYRKQHASDVEAGGMSGNLETQPHHRLIVGWYERVQSWMYRHLRGCLIFFLLTIPGVVGLYWVSEKRMMPAVNYADGIMYVDWNAGISVTENDHRIMKVLDRVKGCLETSTSMVGTQDFLLFHTRDITSSEALVYFKCKSASEFQDVQRQMKTAIKDRYPDASVSFSPSGNLFDLMFSSGEPELCLNLQDHTGHRPTVEQAKAFTDTLRTHFPELSIPSVVTEENLQLVANVEQMTMYGISYSQLCDRLSQLAGTNEVLSINHGAGNVPVIMGNFNANREQILSASIRNNEGVDVPLNLLLKERMVLDYKHLYGSEGGEYEPIALNISSREVRKVLNFVSDYEKRHNDVRILSTGDYFSSREMVVGLIWVLAVSLLLLFFILAAQFESMVQPAIILSEIAVDVFFVLLILWLQGVGIDMMSMIGIIVMAGIVINDSILKIDTINVHRLQGMELMRAIELAGHERLMPIIMTSLTTIFSLLPFMSRGSIGADIQFPLSLTILIGMVVGTLVSIFYVPLVYYVIYRKKKG